MSEVLKLSHAKAPRSLSIYFGLIQAGENSGKAVLDEGDAQVISRKGAKVAKYLL
jgi:hypothetical protein